MRVKSEKRNLGEEDRVWEHVSRRLLHHQDRRLISVVISDRDHPQRPVRLIHSGCVATRRSRFGQRESNAPCLCDASTLPLTPPPVPSCGSRPSAGATSASATSSAAPAAGRRLSRSTLSARGARRRRHSHRNPSSDSSVAPLSIEARAPGRALSALRPGVAVQRMTRLAWRTTPRDASPCTPCPNAWRPPPTRGQW